MSGKDDRRAAPSLPAGEGMRRNQDQNPRAERHGEIDNRGRRLLSLLITPRRRDCDSPPYRREAGEKGIPAPAGSSASPADQRSETAAVLIDRLSGLKSQQTPTSRDS